MIFNDDTAVDRRGLFTAEYDSRAKKPIDNIGKRLISMADSYNWWADVKLLYNEDQPAGFITISRTKMAPNQISLRQLFILSDSRGLGLGTKAVEYCINLAIESADYFRVSAEKSSKDFYEKKLGLQFWGQQKHGTWLCLAKIENKTLIYPADDPYILKKALAFGKRGAVYINTNKEGY